MNIYNIEKKYLELADAIIDQDGVPTPEQETALALNREELEIKAVNYGYVMKRAQDEADAIDQEIKRLYEMKQSRQKLISRIKETVAEAMILYDIEKIEMRNLKISFRASTSVEITDIMQIPDQYKREKIEVSISKAEIGKDLKAGVDVPGAYLSTNKNIQFK